MRAIYLIGFMGAGKTTVSQELSRRMNVAVYDTDEEIVKRTGMSINEIFSNEGEEKFRLLETEVLRSMPSNEAVIATGGGIIGSEENRLYLKDKVNVVYLHAELENILERLKDDNSRPLLRKDKMKTAEALYLSRLQLYREAARLEINTSDKTVQQIVDDIIQRIKK
ncbi:shikimate kinase [Bacillus sp. ISL-35]|uniref:shikimate kinase n=1 Tax=Bacillus sp. ISL-35 TaxID=2819122 RepID=UPI001BE6A9D7|nr:shikimate kinase [Bacillus sp. ISL-35]MBT2677527.1 shikimate kinase [Bacillus sp. ISL-35]MBT2702085.1 shikimate kinase [Chryseobacterium sp. ISL-80]